jgi:hypothetical protein
MEIIGFGIGFGRNFGIGRHLGIGRQFGVNPYRNFGSQMLLNEAILFEKLSSYFIFWFHFELKFWQEPKV